MVEKIYVKIAIKTNLLSLDCNLYAIFIAMEIMPLI